MQIMLCLKFSRSARPCIVSNGLLPPTAALSGLAMSETSRFKPVEDLWNICRPVAGKRHRSCVPQLRPRPPSMQSQGQFAHNITRGIYHRCGLARSEFLLLRLSPLDILPSCHKLASTPTPYATQSLVRRCLIHRPPHVRSHATAYDPVAILLQPLDPSRRRQSVRRGFAISLPVLVIYLLLYLLNFVSWESELGQQYRSTVVYFWTYRRYEWFRDVASQGTYVTSQFTHDGLTSMVIDSLVLIGAASILGSVFNRRTFFAIYVLGGFFAAAADCASARFISPCRTVTQAQFDQIVTSARLFDEASTNFAKLLASSQVFTRKGFLELLTHPENFLSEYGPELERQGKLIDTYRSQVRDWDIWTRPNRAARGSLACLLSVAAVIRPRTIINVIGVLPSVQLYKLVGAIYGLNLYMSLATKFRWNYQACFGGHLAAALLWFSWLRRGRIGSLASALRAFDKVNKPTKTISITSVYVLGVIANVMAYLFFVKDSKAAGVPDPPQGADETGPTPSGEANEDAVSVKETQEENAGIQSAAANDDGAAANDKD